MGARAVMMAAMTIIAVMTIMTVLALLPALLTLLVLWTRFARVAFHLVRLCFAWFDDIDIAGVIGRQDFGRIGYFGVRQRNTIGILIDTPFHLGLVLRLGQQMGRFGRSLVRSAAGLSDSESVMLSISRCTS